MSSRSSCFDCGSSDGLAIYPDGSYCHACHKQTKSHSLIDQAIAEIKKPLALPIDTGQDMPLEARKWLLQYLSDSEIELFSFWSDQYKRICFPYYIRPEGKDHSEMIMCWARTLVQPSKMKWIFLGDNTLLPFFIPANNHFAVNKICLVEDVISGVKVSKFVDVIVLGTTDIGKDSPILAKLEQYEEVILFLDGDAAGKKGSEKLRNQLKLLYNIKVIRNNRDPKNYSNAELSGFIL